MNRRWPCILISAGTDLLLPAIALAFAISIALVTVAQAEIARIAIRGHVEGIHRVFFAADYLTLSILGIYEGAEVSGHYDLDTSTPESEDAGHFQNPITNVELRIGAYEISGPQKVVSFFPTSQIGISETHYTVSVGGFDSPDLSPVSPDFSIHLVSDTGHFDPTQLTVEPPPLEGLREAFVIIRGELPNRHHFSLFALLDELSFAGNSELEIAAEALVGLVVRKNKVIAWVYPEGCPTVDDFETIVRGGDPVSVYIKRRDDYRHCQQTGLSPVRLRLDTSSLGLAPGTRFRVRNPIATGLTP